MASVEARAAQAQADNERKVMELQQKAAIEADKHERESEKLMQQMAKHEADASQAQQLLEAQIDKLRADTYAILVKAGVAKDQQALNEFKSVSDVHARTQDQAMQADRHAVEDQFRERGEGRADRQQELTETTAMDGDD